MLAIPPHRLLLKPVCPCAPFLSTSSSSQILSPCLRLPTYPDLAGVSCALLFPFLFASCQKQGAPRQISATARPGVRASRQRARRSVCADARRGRLSVCLPFLSFSPLRLILSAISCLHPHRVGTCPTGQVGKQAGEQADGNGRTGHGSKCQALS